MNSQKKFCFGSALIGTCTAALFATVFSTVYPVKINIGDPQPEVQAQLPEDLDDTKPCLSRLELGDKAIYKTEDMRVDLEGNCWLDPEAEAVYNRKEINAGVVDIKKYEDAYRDVFGTLLIEHRQDGYHVLFYKDVAVSSKNNSWQKSKKSSWYRDENWIPVRTFAVGEASIPVEEELK